MQYFSTQYNLDLIRLETVLFFEAVLELFYIWTNWYLAFLHIFLLLSEDTLNSTLIEGLPYNVSNMFRYIFCKEFSVQNNFDYLLSSGFYKLQHLVLIVSSICYDKISRLILDHVLIF